MIEVCGLAKAYGVKAAVQGLSFTVGKGEIFGLIGPNGAGKTSTIRMLATVLRPTAGDARIGGHSISTQAPLVRQQIGYMPDLYGVYEGMNVEDYLRFFAAAYLIPADRLSAVVGQILELVDLTDLRQARIGELSRGTQQRISLARTLVHDPQVLILDEPASGLDPRARIEIRELLRELKGMGKTILISSHILPELEEICTRVGILDHGRLVWSGTPGEAGSSLRGARRVRIRPVEKIAEALALIERLPGVTAARCTDAEIEVEWAHAAGTPAPLARALHEHGIGIVHLAEERPSLEDIFLAVTQKPPVEAPAAT